MSGPNLGFIDRAHGPCVRRERVLGRMDMYSTYRPGTT